MKLAEYLDEKKLYEHLNGRVVNAQHHHYAPLTIYNYGQKAQFEGIWDDVTCKCRGLIVDESTGEIVARPFLKFFNAGETKGGLLALQMLPSDMPEAEPPQLGQLELLYQSELGISKVKA